MPESRTPILTRDAGRPARSGEFEWGTQPPAARSGEFGERGGIQEGVQLRECFDVQVRDAGDGERLVEGYMVPWDTKTRIGFGMSESFARGAFDGVTADDVQFYGVHGWVRGEFPIGKLTKTEARDKGQWFQARISRTPRGDEAYTLMRDGVIKKFSVGFEPQTDSYPDDDDPDHVRRDKVNLREVSAVGMPAYDGAELTAVRDRAPITTTPRPEETTRMTPEEIQAAINAAVTQLREQDLADIDRRMATITPPAPSDDAGDAPIAFRSLGEFVKALGSKDHRPAGFDAHRDAEALTRAYAAAATEVRDTATTADLNGVNRPAWINRDIKVVEENRELWNYFSHEPLPAEGLSIEYPKFKSKTGDVAKQTAEATDLAYIEIQFDKGTAAIDTYGAYSSLSRQVIERAPVSYLNKVLQVQRFSYAKITNAVARTILTGNKAQYNQLTLADADKSTPVAWELLALDGLAAIHRNAIALEGDCWWMSLAAFRDLVSVTDTTGRPVFVVNGDGANSLGSVNLRNIKNLRANVAGLDCRVDFDLADGDSYITAKDAITVMESPGAPHNLTDENIVNLTKDFSLYGYDTGTLNDPKGITYVTHAVAAP